MEPTFLSCAHALLSPVHTFCVNKLFPVGSKPAVLPSRTPPGKNPNHEEGEQGNGKGSHGSGVVCHPGNEKEEAASHGSHHQERRGRLGVDTQSGESQREDGGKHDTLEEVVEDEEDKRGRTSPFDTLLCQGSREQHGPCTGDFHWHR